MLTFHLISFGDFKNLTLTSFVYFKNFVFKIAIFKMTLILNALALN